MDTKTLNGIRAAKWVLITVAKANAQGDTTMKYWRHAWEETYFSLGGKSTSVARKGCPMKAAYGLWRSGRIAGHEQKDTTMSAGEVRERYGKNAAYAHLALELLVSNKAFENAQSLWRAVQDEYRSKLQEEPAASEQGAVRIAMSLHHAGVAH